MHNKLLYGKNETKQIVSLEVKEDKLHIFTKQGKEVKDFDYYILYNRYIEGSTDGRLDGTNELKYYSKFKSSKELYDFEQILKHKEIKYFKPRSPKEAAMLKDGYTYYKDLKIEQLSVLSFDLETTGATIDDNSYILLISNTFRDARGIISRKLFSFDDFDTPAAFIKAWCKWVRDCDPDVLLGHNIFGFDFPYLKQFCANQNIDSLHLGRDASKLKYDRIASKFRKDQSQSYDFINISCYGREIIDTMFLSIKYDQAVRKFYESYGLKYLIKKENLEKAERQHYDASKIKTSFTNPTEWAKIKKYAEHDADDALALFDLMAPSFFYFTQIVPMSFQQIINKATGVQLNNILIRAYLQDKKAIPYPSDAISFKGATTLANPGIYEHVYKVDVASLYPSIVLSRGFEPTGKDPDHLFQKIIKDLTDERLKNKKLFKETGDSQYDGKQAAQKIGINTGSFGLLGAPGLNFNCPQIASDITRVGREILDGAVKWCESKGYLLVNADTDSISFTSGKTLEIKTCIEEINKISGNGINWEDDGYYSKVIVMAGKNYVLLGKNLTIKGSALKATTKEKALKRYIDEVINILIEGNLDALLPHYEKYVKEINNLKDIKDWCSKKTITKKILDPKRTNESRILDAVSDIEGMQEGDKVYVFFKTDKELCTAENFTGKYSKKKLFDKLYKTVKIFESVIDIKQFKNYGLVKNMKELDKQTLFDFENHVC